MKTRNITLGVEEWARIVSAPGNGKVNIPVWLRVSGNSMSPTIRRYRDRVLLSPAEPEELKEDDIVLLPWNGVTADYCLHRIHRVDGDRIQTMGDANRRPDGWIDKKDILGKVIRIQHGSWVEYAVNLFAAKMNRIRR